MTLPATAASDEATQLRDAALLVAQAGLTPVRQPTDDHELIRDEMLGVIERGIAAHPRSQQAAIGPSEIGHPCDRWLGYKFGGIPPARLLAPSWRATVGTAVHAWLAEQLVADNRRTGYDRWLSETKVDVGEIGDETIIGSCDAYDAITSWVIDFKIVGPTSLKKYKLGVDPKYRTQVHLYARGWERLGLPVRGVAILYLPSAGDLTDRVWWAEPYEENRAVAALQRATDIEKAVRLVGADLIVPRLTATPTYCQYCPWYRPGSTDLATGCPGDSAAKARTGIASLQNLITTHR